MTDVLGTCTSWGDGVCVIEPDGRRSKEAVTIRWSEIVSGKPVPPRPSPRHRVSPQEAQRRALALWPDLETRPVGDWLLRHSPTSSARRANSVLAMTPSGRDDDYEQVVAFYEGQGQRPIAAVLPGSAEDALFRSHGWVLESHDRDTVFQLGSVAAARRSLAGVPLPDLDVALVGGDQVVTVEVSDDGRILASGVAAVADDWVGFRRVEVDQAQRGRRLGLLVMAELLDWGAERGATTAYLQVLADNARAFTLYDGLGFREHHRYRYLGIPLSPGGREA
jgi:GNAT superfamily N-acetyltransferase